MADKLGSTIRTSINFVAGENALPTKFTTMFNTLKNAIQKLELAVGDLHDESYPYFNSTDTLSQATRSSLKIDLGEGDKKLDIVNLSRIIGPASSLNPLHLCDIETSESYVTESVPTGKISFKLKYVPFSGTVTFSGSDTTSFVSEKVSSATALIDGDYYIDYTTGEVTVIKVTVAGASVTYRVSTVWDAFASYPSSSFNVIPDPSQSTKCSATGPSGGYYTISLPLVETQELDDTGLTSTISSSHVNYDSQLKLPYVLDGLISGDVIPKGFILLRDETTNELFMDAIFTYDSQDSVKVSNVTLDVTHGFSLLTVGTNITQSIQSLNLKLWRLRRGLDTYAAIPAANIANKTGTSLASGQEPYVKSDLENNYFPQYLHRDGWLESDDGNINDQNGMRGDLVLLSSKRTANSRNNISSSSRKLWFGSHSDGPYMYYIYSATVPRLQINANSLSIEFSGNTHASDGISMGGIGSPWPLVKVLETSVTVDFATDGAARDLLDVAMPSNIETELTGKTILSVGGTITYGGYIVPLYYTEYNNGTLVTSTLFSASIKSDFSEIRFANYNPIIGDGLTVNLIIWYKD